MKYLLILLTLCFSRLMVADAQTFTQRLQNSRAGEGRITLSQSKAIDDLVNGPAQQSAAPGGRSVNDGSGTSSTGRQNSRTSEKSDGHKDARPDSSRAVPRAQQPQRTDTVTIEDDGRKKVMRGGYKINGYRVQVYAGGNSRDARIKAERTGKEINALFPGTPVYVHFYSPRWICRMGNYRTYEEASEVLRSVKKLGYQSAIIVKGKITVAHMPAQTPDSE